MHPHSDRSQRVRGRFKSHLYSQPPWQLTRWKFGIVCLCKNNDETNLAPMSGERGEKWALLHTHRDARLCVCLCDWQARGDDEDATNGHWLERYHFKAAKLCAWWTFSFFTWPLCLSKSMANAKALFVWPRDEWKLWWKVSVGQSNVWTLDAAHKKPGRKSLFTVQRWCQGTSFVETRPIREEGA